MLLSSSTVAVHICTLDRVTPWPEQLLWALVLLAAQCRILGIPNCI